LTFDLPQFQILFGKELFLQYNSIKAVKRSGTMPEKERQPHEFEWKDLGDIEKGRPNLGATAPVLAYRLLQYTMRDVLVSDFGAETAAAILVKAGRLAGKQFCENMLEKQLGFNEFIAQLQHILKEQAIGILRVEHVDLEKMHFILTVAEDLDCSGLPCTDDVVCQYDEGFIAGILESYTGKSFLAKEIDCWASGDRVCRFDVRVVQDVA
jgi:predicted hydrocarbon binding protein